MPDSRRIAETALLLLPAIVVVYLAFHSGGFYPGPPAYVAMVLCAVLLTRVLMARDPFEGAGWMLAVAVAALAIYSLLTLVAGSWSHAPGSAVIEFDRALMYLLAMAVFGSLARNRERLLWMLRSLAAGLVVICVCGLITRLLPQLWPTTPEIANNRLSFPVTYWNVLGLLAAMGIVLCLHFSGDIDERPVTRVAAAAAAPVFATTLFFTFSRGAIAACFIVVFTYALAGRPRALISALCAIVPTTAIAIKLAYDANVLATPTPTTGAALTQGRHVALAVAVCVAVAAGLRAVLARWLDMRLARLTLPGHRRRGILRAGWASLGAAALIAVVVLNGKIVHEYHLFVRSGGPGRSADLRSRLTDPGNNGRIDMWRVAWRQFRAAPLVGNGPGTFQYAWAQRRPTSQSVVDAHSLYMETLDELGAVGFLLLVGVIALTLVGAALRIRGPSRPLYAALFSLLVAWAIHSGIDWDWDMPVVTLLFFGLGGFALARPVDPTLEAGPRAHSSLASGTRVLLGVGCLVIAITPTYVWLSQRKLDAAARDFAQGNCTAATREARSSISILGVRPEPYEILSYCDIRANRPRPALAAIDEAISLDPGNWNYRYGLALVRGAAGLDPRAAARMALSLNPRDPLAQDVWTTFSTDTPSQWQSDAKAIADEFTSL